MTDKPCFLAVDVLQNFITDMFISLGVSHQDAAVCAEVLITSDLRGVESHGVGRIKYYYDQILAGQIIPRNHFEIIRETPTTAMVDGHYSMGMVTSTKAMQMAIDKARVYGMGSVAVRHSAHYGIAGYYTLMAAKQDMIGLSFTNASPSVAPTFGVKPMFGTNPIAFGAPTDEPFPFLFDAATSIIPSGKLEIASRERKSIAEGLVIDNNGDYLTDPDQIRADKKTGLAAHLTLGGFGEALGGHKGYGLAMIVEILSAALQDGNFLTDLSGRDEEGNLIKYGTGHFFLAINIQSFTALDNFKHTTGEIMRSLRNSSKIPGYDRIFTAGEKEFEIERRVRDRGVQILPDLQEDISIIKKELGLENYHFPFE